HKKPNAVHIIDVNIMLPQGAQIPKALYWKYGDEGATRIPVHALVTSTRMDLPKPSEDGIVDLR
ncbi:MAG: hypothetical protein ACKPKO_57280, partial [Candidatus Fonsibacter sp.]